MNYRYPLQLHVWQKKPQMTFKANLFNEYFQSVYTVSSAFVGPFAPDPASILKDFDTSMERVLGIVHKLDETKSRGADNLPPSFFQKCRYHSRELVTNFHKSEANWYISS